MLSKTKLGPRKNKKTVEVSLVDLNMKSHTNLTKRPTVVKKKSKMPQIKFKGKGVNEEKQTKFRVSIKLVKKAVEGIITLTSTNPKLKNKLFNEHFPLFLQINSIKVPKIHSKIVRIPLKHSILTRDSEVCLIVPDVKGIQNKKHEEHLEHYEKLLDNRGVTNINKIMTFHEFRTEYETFELKNRLVELYDAFLVDGKISGKVVKKSGKIFYNKRKIPTPIKLQATKLKEHIEQVLKKTSLYLHSKGDSFMVQIGHSKMTSKELVENIFSLFEGLDKHFPGGFGNIRNLNLYTFRGITIPIFTTLKNQNQVVVNDVKKTETKTVAGELSTRLNSGVSVKATGEVIVYKLNDDEEDGENQKKKKENAGRPLKRKNVKENQGNENPTKKSKKKLKTDKVRESNKTKMLKTIKNKQKN